MVSHIWHTYFFSIPTLVRIFPPRVDIFLLQWKYPHGGGTWKKKSRTCGPWCKYFDLCGYIYTQMKICIPWLKYVYLVWNNYTRRKYVYHGGHISTWWTYFNLVDIFLPRLKYLYPGWNIVTLVEIFIPKLNYLYLVGNIYILVEILLPQWKYLYPVKIFSSGWELTIFVYVTCGYIHTLVEIFVIMVEIFQPGGYISTSVGWELTKFMSHANI